MGAFSGVVLLAQLRRLRRRRLGFVREPVQALLHLVAMTVACAALIDARLQFGPKLHEQPVRRLHPDGALGRRRLELVDAAGVRLLFRTPALLRLLGLGLARRQQLLEARKPPAVGVERDAQFSDLVRQRSRIRLARGVIAFEPRRAAL